LQPQSFSPAKIYQPVRLCTPDPEEETTYVVYSGERSTGTATDGLYSGRTYSGGTHYTTFAISCAVTYAGSSDDGMTMGDSGGMNQNGGSMQPPA
jgi:chitodextrinase